MTLELERLSDKIIETVKIKIPALRPQSVQSPFLGSPDSGFYSPEPKRKRPQQHYLSIGDSQQHSSIEEIPFESVQVNAMSSGSQVQELSAPDEELQSWFFPTYTIQENMSNRHTDEHFPEDLADFIMESDQAVEKGLVTSLSCSFDGSTVEEIPKVEEEDIPEKIEEIQENIQEDRESFASIICNVIMAFLILYVSYYFYEKAMTDPIFVH